MGERSRACGPVRELDREGDIGRRRMPFLPPQSGRSVDRRRSIPPAHPNKDAHARLQLVTDRGQDGIFHTSGIGIEFGCVFSLVRVGR